MGFGIFPLIIKWFPTKKKKGLFSIETENKMIMCGSLVEHKLHEAARTRNWGRGGCLGHTWTVSIWATAQVRFILGQ